MAKKKTAKKAAKKTAKKTAKTAASGKYSLVEDVLDSIMEVAEVSKKGEIKLKKTDVKNLLEECFQRAAVVATGGEKVRIPFLGNLMFSEVKARKAGKGVNPFTGEPMEIKARPASRKPRFSFARTAKETFANKRNW